MAADLHVHTTCSDSTRTPRQVIEQCARCPIGTVAITDHDAVDGVAAASAAGAELGVVVVPGVEMTAYVAQSEVHVVGLFVDPADGPLCAVLRQTREARRLRVYRMVDRLRALGVNVSAEAVFDIAAGGAPGRIHVAQALMRSGQVSSIADAFGYYIGNGRPAHVPKQQLSPAEAAAVIHGAGGAAVLAHPGAGLPDALVRQVMAEGMDALEAYHPLHLPHQVQHYQDLARDLGAAVSGGSDSHGDIEEGAQIGEIVIDDALVAEIERRAILRRSDPARRK